MSAGKAGVPDALIVLHGYGFLAEYFLRHFDFLPEDFPDLCVYAPEGLSRFYKEGFYGQVGASWMTKEDRNAEIQDQQTYLDLLAAHIYALNPKTRIHVLGFSQGASTAWRWIDNGNIKPESCVFWSGEIPNTFSETVTKKLTRIPLFHVHASADEFIPVEMAIAQYQKLLAHFSNIQSLPFEGTHTLNKDTLRKIYSEVLGLA